MSKKRFGLIVVIVVVCVFLVLILMGLLYSWTKSIDSKKRQNELVKTMKEVIGVYGEKGLLEMAGIPVNEIFYGENGLTLFQGDEASWTYSAEELLNMGIFEKCNKAVVHIETRYDSGVSDLLKEIPSNGVGSGFFISADGYIVTNYHVISGAKNILVTDWEAAEYEATVIGFDAENDIALLKILPTIGSKFLFLEFANSDSLTVGQKVLAIGNPFGFDRTMVSGIISGLSRPIRDENGKVLLGMIQTDAPINPGASGCPLLNLKGKVVGVSTSIYSQNGTSQGMNFAVSSNTAQASTQELMKFGKICRGWLDIVPVQLSPQIVDYASLKTKRGILVSQVISGGKAEKAGIRGGNTKVSYGSSIIYLGGDVITSINGMEIYELSDLYNALSNTKPRDKVDVTVNRNGILKTIKVELVERTGDNSNGTDKNDRK